MVKMYNFNALDYNLTWSQTTVAALESLLTGKHVSDSLREGGSG